MKKQITDYNDFRKMNFGSLRLSNNGTSIDTLWQELSNTYPYYFNDDITTESDMLYELADFMQKDVTVKEKYKLSDEEIDYTTNKVYNSLMHNTITDEEINTLRETHDKRMEERTKQIIRDELISDMGITYEMLSNAQSKKGIINSLDYQRTDPVRLNEKEFGYEVGKKINESTVYATRHNEARRTRWLNSEREEIRKLCIKARSKESELVQKFGEQGFYDKNGNYYQYTIKNLIEDVPNEF